MDKANLYKERWSKLLFDPLLDQLLLDFLLGLPDSLKLRAIKQIASI